MKKVKSILAGKKKEAPPEPPKKRHKSTAIEHHGDGSHTVRHTPHGGGEDVSYSKPDLDGLHDALEEHLGEPNHDEGEGVKP